MTSEEIQAIRLAEANKDLKESIVTIHSLIKVLLSCRSWVTQVRRELLSEILRLESLVNDFDGSSDLFSEAVALLLELKEE